jgi:hypothetical protein
MKNRGLKILLFSIFCLLTAHYTTIHAQIGTWKTYFAYQNDSIVVETPHLVFAVYDGSLVSYNPADEEVRTYSFKDGLHDVDITHLVYSPEANALVIVYKNSNIDIFVRENEVYNLPDIVNTTKYQNKEVNNLELIDGYAYLSTTFGIVVVDVKRKEVKDTYNTGAEVKSVYRDGNDFLAGTTVGIKIAPVSANLLDPENWKDYDKTETLVDINKMLKFQGKLIFRKGEYVFALNDNGSLTYFDQNTIRQITLLNDQLVLLGDHEIYFFSDLETFVKIPVNAYSIDCRNSQNVYWIGAGNEGLAAFSKPSNTSDFKTTVSGIKINSPQTNLNFFMTFSQGKLLVTGGGRSGDRNYKDGAFMVYEKGQWFNFDPQEIAEKTGLWCKDFMSAVVDPRDPNHYFVSSYGEGVYEFQDNQFVKLHSLDNSSLQSSVTPPSNLFVRVDGLVYDKNNNLYVANVGAMNGLAIYSAKNEWANYYYKQLSTANLNQVLIDRNNQKWMNIWRTNSVPVKPAIVVLNENNTIGDISDDKVFYNMQFNDQLGTDISATAYTCMAEDQNGIIWVGTDNGPVYFYSATDVENSKCTRIISTDKYGNNFYLMESLKVTAIAVDGGNRKWMGTSDAGVFVLDQSDPSAIKVENYTTENSFLISDAINSIAINDETGEVFIGTDKGLCSYRGEAVVGKPDYSNVYAFPNPVRPSSNNQVTITGLKQNSTVKITDLSGNLIKEGKSLGGQFTWNCTDRTDSTVKAGIYLVFAASADGNNGTDGVVTKIMVIK